ncbi:MAG: hypothetical protein JNL24_02225 [Bacteroidia bacterium]|nr:hypothetical protein [Bacteroidia bacterium]
MKKILIFSSFLFLSYLPDLKAQTQITSYANSEKDNSKIVFHVDGMNTKSDAQFIQTKLNTDIDKITSEKPNWENHTVVVNFKNGITALDIMEIIHLAGYKPWYIDAQGKKVVMNSQGKLETWNVKP